jgi:hypothetical protein
VQHRVHPLFTPGSCVQPLQGRGIPPLVFGRTERFTLPDTDS